MVLQVAERSITTTGKENFLPLPSFLHDTDLEIQFGGHGLLASFSGPPGLSFGSLYVFSLLPHPAHSSEVGILLWLSTFANSLSCVLWH